MKDGALTDEPDPAHFGIPTLHCRVESWECDFNGHWNARFYARSFRLAFETLPWLPGVTGSPRDRPDTRILRFHRELFVGTPVEVRSARVTSGPYAGAVAHLLHAGGRLSASSLDLGTGAVEGLPDAPAEMLSLIEPRSLDAEGTWTDGSATSVCETGPIRPEELDPRGALLPEEVFRRAGFATHTHVGALGLDERYFAETGISRMSVETRVTAMAAPPAGTPLRARARMSRRATKAFAFALLLETHAGRSAAFVEHYLVTVDLNTRRAVELPEFLRAPEA